RTAALRFGLAASMSALEGHNAAGATGSDTAYSTPSVFHMQVASPSFGQRFLWRGTTPLMTGADFEYGNIGGVRVIYEYQNAGFGLITIKNNLPYGDCCLRTPFVAYKSDYSDIAHVFGLDSDQFIKGGGSPLMAPEDHLPNSNDQSGTPSLTAGFSIDPVS